jgi:hypothetical protein
MELEFRWAGMAPVIVPAESMNFLDRSMAGGFFAIWDSDKGCKELEDVLVEQWKAPVGLRPGTTVAVSCFLVAKRNEVGTIHTKDGRGICTAHSGTKHGLRILKTIGLALTQTRYYLRKDRPWNHSASQQISFQPCCRSSGIWTLQITSHPRNWCQWALLISLYFRCRW